MAQQNYIDVLIRMVNASKYQSDAKKAADATAGIGKSAEKTGKQADSSLRSMLRWVGATAAFATAAHYLHGAVSESIDLGRASIQLNRITGMGVETTSEWILVAKQFGIEGQRLGQMFTQLGRAQQRALAGSKMQSDAFKSIGVSVQDLRTLDATGLTERIADAFQRMPDGLQKAALAQQFFGRTGRQLLPILNQGGASLQEQLDLVQKYGAALEGKTAADIQKMIKQQRELHYAQMGFNEQMADALIPTLLALSTILSAVLKASQPLLHNQTAMTVVLVTLTAAWVAYSAAIVVARLEMIGFRTVFMSTGIGLLVVGLSIAIVELIEHWGAVSEAFRNAGRWIARESRIIGGWFDYLGRKADAFWGKIKTPLSLISGFGEAKFAFGVGKSVVGAFANGTNFAPGGMSLVGERGPELVNVPRGSQVIPLDSRSGGGGLGDVHVTVAPSDVKVGDQVLARIMWKATADRQARR